MTQAQPEYCSQLLYCCIDTNGQQLVIYTHPLVFSFVRVCHTDRLHEMKEQSLALCYAIYSLTLCRADTD